MPYFKGVEEKRHSCFNCKEELVFEVKIGRRDMCPNCGAYLHCCLNCEHHDPAVHNECRERQGEFIRDRKEGNFCLYFEFRALADGGSAQDDARSKLDALFGGGGAASAKKPTLGDVTPRSPRTEDDARTALDQLFKK